MEKRKDAAIYVFGYNKTPYDLPDNALYTPIQCGVTDNTEMWLKTGDNTGDNISDMNHFYAEGSGVYWVWKHHSSELKHIGQCQYRRWLWFDEDIDFDEIFGCSDVIMPEPYYFGNTIRNHYRTCHNYEDLEVMESVIKECYPNYYPAFESILNGNLLYYSAGMIMRASDYDKYCEFLFGALGEFRNRLGFNTMKDVEKHVKNAFRNNKYSPVADKKISYQMLMGGFLSERLLSTFVITEFRKQLIVKYKLF